MPDVNILAVLAAAIAVFVIGLPTTPCWASSWPK